MSNSSLPVTDDEASLALATRIRAERDFELESDEYNQSYNRTKDDTTPSSPPPSSPPFVQESDLRNPNLIVLKACLEVALERFQTSFNEHHRFKKSEFILSDALLTPFPF